MQISPFLLGMNKLWITNTRVLASHGGVLPPEIGDVLLAPWDYNHPAVLLAKVLSHAHKKQQT